MLPLPDPTLPSSLFPSIEPLLLIFYKITGLHGYLLHFPAMRCAHKKQHNINNQQSTI